MNDVSLVVLVADDEPDTLELIKHHLEKAGYTVLGASNGGEAYKIAVEHRPALAVLDVRMPRVDGYDLVARIREHDEIGWMPIILLTAGNRVAEMQRGFDVGADSYMVKPFNAKELLDRVGTMIGSG